MKKILTILFLFVQTISYSQAKSFEYVGRLSQYSTYDSPMFDKIDNDKTTFFMTDSTIYYTSRLTEVFEVNSPSITSWINDKSFRYYETDDIKIVYDEQEDEMYMVLKGGTTYIFFN